MALNVFKGHEGFSETTEFGMYPNHRLVKDMLRERVMCFCTPILLVRSYVSCKFEAGSTLLGDNPRSDLRAHAYSFRESTKPGSCIARQPCGSPALTTKLS